MRRGLAVLALLAAVPLAACAGAPGPTPTQTASSSPQPSATQTAAPIETPEPPSPAPAAMITIDYDGFTISDAQGLTLYRHDWSDISAPTVGALTSAFGAAPALTPVEGDAHFAGGTAYEWDGLRLIDRDQAPERNAVSTMVIVSQSQIGSVVVTTQLGLGVGAAGADAAAVSNEIAPPRPDSGLGSVYCSRPTPDSMAICFDGDQADAIYRIRAPLTGL